MSIVRKQLDEIPPMSKERAAEIESLSDEDIDDSDIPALDEEFFQKAKRVRGMTSQKKKIQSNL